MIRYLTILFSVIIVLIRPAYGQQGFNYQMTMISNPSVTGSAGDGMVRISYLNLYPGNSYNLHSACISYDGFFPGLHGGAGFYVSDEYLGGIINNLNGGFSYAYYLRASEDLYINAGLSASFYHRAYNFRDALLPDQIDPLLGGIYPSTEVLPEGGRTVFDLATGFLVIYRNFYGGFSVTHLAEPDPSHQGFADGSLRRKLLVHMAADLNAGKNLRLLPMAMVNAGKGFFNTGAGISAESRYLSVNALILADNVQNMDIQTGFSFEAAGIILFYNYRFNIVSGEELKPFSLLHHTGLVFSLNNVDKRKIIKTINFPHL